ncbi:TPA: hypothetical protein ACF2DE_002881 [Clostridium perfringens]
MGRELKRVPLDFDYPLGKVWYGYAPSLKDFKNNKEITKIVPEIKYIKTIYVRVVINFLIIVLKMQDIVFGIMRI